MSLSLIGGSGSHLGRIHRLTHELDRGRKRPSKGALERENVLATGDARALPSRAMRASLKASLAAALLISCGSPPRYPITDPSMVLRQIRARDERVRSLRAHGSADQFGAQGRIRGEVFVFVSRPSLRVDTRAFGNTVSTIVTDGRRFSMADFRGGNFFIGRARPCVAAQLLGIPLEAAEVVSMLAGGPPLIEGDSRIRWDDGHYVLDITGASGNAESLELTITSEEHDSARPEQQHPRPSTVTLRDARGVRAELTFDDYESVSGVDFPRSVRVLMERDSVDLKVRYREVSLDPDLPEDAFDLAPPSDALTVQEVTCADDPPTANEDAPRASDAGVSPANTGDASAADAGAGDASAVDAATRDAATGG